MSGSAWATASSLRDQSTRLNTAILTHFRHQPLVGGALAFAVGAAIGAALPHTDTEDELLGDAADSVKTDISSQASDLAEQGKDIASEAYDKAVAVASDVHDATQDRIIEEVDKLKDGNA